MRKLLLMLSIAIGTAGHATATEPAFATGIANRAATLVQQRDCASLARAATLVASLQVLRIFDASIIDREAALAQVLSVLAQRCPGTEPAFLDFGCSLGAPVPVSGGTVGGGGRDIPALVVAYSHMNTEERRTFLKALPEDTRTELTSWIANNREAFKAEVLYSTKLLQTERTLKLDEEEGTMKELNKELLYNPKKKPVKIQ